MIKIWLQAARLRTLPLALSSIAMGNFLAYFDGSLRIEILLLTILTTLFLQILSNFANDYGDSVHGVDSNERSGPARMVQSGAISLKSMRLAIILMAVLSLLSGVLLIWTALASQLDLAFGFLGLGFICIAAAVYYTNGKIPYGYLGLGDASVFLFFGLVGVLGSYYLQRIEISSSLLLPAVSNGLLAVGVLNINNIRDIDSDRKAGKFSIPVRIGRKNAVVYHGILLLGASLSALTYALWYAQNSAVWIFLFVLPIWWTNFSKLKQNQQVDKLLKPLAISSLLFTLLFGLGMMLRF